MLIISLKALSLNTVTLKIRVSIYEFGEDTNLQSIAEAKYTNVFNILYKIYNIKSYSGKLIVKYSKLCIIYI